MNVMEANGIYYIDGINFKIPFQVWQYIMLEFGIIAKLDWEEIENKRPDLDERRCIWCFNFDGSVKWMIEPPYFIDKEGNKKLIIDDAFLELVYRDASLRAYTSFGHSYDLDIETGKITNWKHHK